MIVSYAGLVSRQTPCELRRRDTCGVHADKSIAPFQDRLRDLLVYELPGIIAGIYADRFHMVIKCFEIDEIDHKIEDIRFLSIRYHRSVILNNLYPSGLCLSMPAAKLHVNAGVRRQGRLCWRVSPTFPATTLVLKTEVRADWHH